LRAAVAAGADVEIVAFPLASVAVPTVVEPFFNVTTPVGVPLPGATVTTVIVKVTDLPSVDGFSEEVRVVELADIVAYARKCR